jgi:ribosomal protein S18 acetylase RimI-like enzyme
MSTPSGIEVRPARLSDRRRLDEFLSRAARGPGAEEAGAFSNAPVSNHILAIRDDAVVGACLFIPGAGRCAALQPPRLLEWDEHVAADLYSAAAARSYCRDGARLIQALVEPDGGPLAAALERAGFERLAMLAYLRRDVMPEERDTPLAADIKWRRYWLLRHGQFARTIALTYHDSLDCPGLAGLRTVDDAITTHRRTGIFCPYAWHLAIQGGEAVGVILVNNLHGRGEVAYLGVASAARRRGIGRALVARAIHDTAVMGLPMIGLAVDVANTPAMRLYEETGFREIRRRLAYFIPASGLEALK